MSLPSVQVSTRDYGELIMMIARLRGRAAGLLITEIRRAAVDVFGPPDVVRIGSMVTFRLDEDPEETRLLTLPECVGPGDVSVAAPLGAALLGLRQGDAFTFKLPGRDRTVRVVAVRPGPQPFGSMVRDERRQPDWRVDWARRRRGAEAVAGMRSLSGRAAPWIGDSALLLFCLASIVLMVAVMSFRYWLPAWLRG